MTKLFIVESPNKVKTIKGLLGPDWEVHASVGHITELAKGGFSNTGIHFLEGGQIECQYSPRGERGASVIKKLAYAAKNAELIVLATDPDREGESISWHLLEQVIKGKKKYKRATYREITKPAILNAIAEARDVDMALVNAQRARQCVDKIAGFLLSPLLLNSGMGSSAGRVQSPALHILCKREKEIAAFKPTKYWSLQSLYGEGFKAFYVGSKKPSGSIETDEKERDESQAQEDDQGESHRITKQADAQKIVQEASSNPHAVIAASGKETSKNPPPPLTTSTMQQAAGVRLNFSTDQTMKIAQELFEGVPLPDGTKHGIITYMRSDSVVLSEEFKSAATAWIVSNHPQLAIQKPVVFKDKEGVQGGHEAIRPVDVALTPDMMKAHLTQDQLALYSMIWSRAVASLCTPARIQRSQIVVQAGSTFWEARGARIVAPGYLRIWKEQISDNDLPAVAKGQTLTVQEISQDEKQTTPPPRYSEAKLVQTLEKLGIGRPSTFASIIKTLKAREYVVVKTKSLVPTDIGMKADEAISKVFPEILQSSFTAAMESYLDDIARGEKDWQKCVVSYKSVLEKALASKGVTVMAESRKKSDTPCPTCQKPLTQLPSKYKGEKDHYLKCMEGCDSVVMFWASSVQAWILKGSPEADALKAQKAENAAEPTEFICQICGEPLEKFMYQKDGATKYALRCADPKQHKAPDHEGMIYYLSSKGGFWCFKLKEEPKTTGPARKVETTSKKTRPKKVKT